VIKVYLVAQDLKVLMAFKGLKGIRVQWVRQECKGLRAFLEYRDLRVNRDLRV
jgi:hypothetical protein